MNAKHLAVILSLLLSASVALAESYQIQVRFTVRLRASYSLNSPVVGNALAGDVLQVVGRNNRWLKIERDGEIAWLADWVEYTRLGQQPAQPATAPAANGQTPSNIDNCCFVDRQCQSERDWVDGYWAYQRNECPAQSQPGLSPAPTSGHPITINGSFLFHGIITEALDALRDRAPQWYDYVKTNLYLVNETTPGGSSHGYPAGTCGLSPYSTIAYSVHEWNVYSYVSSLVHYACHSAYRYAGIPYNGYTKVNEESDCVRMDNAATDLVAAHHPPGKFGTVVGISHCDGDLTNSPHCRWVRENCEWGPNMTLLDCPAAGLVTRTLEEWQYEERYLRSLPSPNS
ncbi:MAG: SH3 domain-containing protein [Chloroflexi bacterium]|nr:SH3 domain-containing protein [Chloroflexota bacterium]